MCEIELLSYLKQTKIQYNEEAIEKGVHEFFEDYQDFQNHNYPDQELIFFFENYSVIKKLNTYNRDLGKLIESNYHAGIQEVKALKKQLNFYMLELSNLELISVSRFPIFHQIRLKINQLAK